MADAAEQFDPRAILAALERNYVDYVIIGGLARVLRGGDEITRGVDICPSLAADNLERLTQSARELEARPAARRQPTFDELASQPEEPIVLGTSAGELKIIATPVGAPNGFADLRRAATHEHLGQGLRPLVASTPDLARMAAALHRAPDLAHLRGLRRIIELEVEREAVGAPPVRSPSLAQERALGRGHERGLER